MRRAYPTLAAAVLLAAAVGCTPKLSKSSSFSVGGEKQASSFMLSPVNADQKITVEVTSDNPVDVFVVSTADVPDAVNQSSSALQKKAVAFKTGLATGTFTASVAKNTAAEVVVMCAEKTTAASGTIKLTN